MNFSSKIIYNQVRTLSLFCECDQQVLHKVEPILKGPEHALYGGARTLTPWVPVQITGTQNQQKRKLFCSHCSPTHQQGMISHLNQFLIILCGFTGDGCLIRFDWCVYGSRDLSVGNKQLVTMQSAFPWPSAPTDHFVFAGYIQQCTNYGHRKCALEKN